MALKDWLDSGKCLVGFHDGPWRLDDPQVCVWRQTCARCNKLSERVEHEWAQWSYRSADDCVSRRACSRCHESESRTEHQWGDWSYRSDSGCEQAIRCARCAAWDDQRRIEHDWDPWQYSETYRGPLHQCRRCATWAAYFPEQRIAPPPTGHDDALAKAQELLSDDRAIEAMLQRAEAKAHQGSVAAQEIAAADDANEAKAELNALRQLYAQQISAGAIAAERQPLLNSIMAELEEVLAAPARTLADKQIQARRLQDAMLRLSDALLEPSRETALTPPAADTRLAAITELHHSLQRYVYGETASGALTGEEGQTGMVLLGQLRDSREALVQLAPAGDPLKLERESLRQTAVDIRNFSLRHHLSLIEPIWPSQTVGQNPNAIFYSGDAQLGASLERACASRQLRLLLPQSTTEPTSARWNQLRQCALAVFDFTAFRRNGSLDDASATATVAYELGMALTIGRAAIIVARENQELPFDLDIEPLQINGAKDADELVGAALDRNLFGLQRSRAGSAIAGSVEFLRRRYRAAEDFRVRQALASIDDDTIRDPIKARLLIASLLGFVGAQAPDIVLPTWPGSYPDPEERRCFHVTAFGPSWASATSKIIETECGQRTAYIRGDQVLSPDILRSIWDELCRATHVIVDLTGLNANVVLELGIAHTLGRNVLLVSQDRQPEQYFRAVAKQRIHHYDANEDAARGFLATNVRRFLAV